MSSDSDTGSGRGGSYIKLCSKKISLGVCEILKPKPLNKDAHGF